MTKANPPIFYLPAKLTDKTQKLLEESTRAVKSKSISKTAVSKQTYKKIKEIVDVRMSLDRMYKDKMTNSI